MSAHTPGPWEAVGALVRDARNADGSGGYVVADCHQPTRAMDEGAANARLVAAAPDLLRELKTVARALQWAALVMPDAETRSLALDIVKDADAVIAKATGAA